MFFSIWGLYCILRYAITNHHKLNGLKRQKCIFSLQSSEGCKCEIQVLQALIPPEAVEKGPVLSSCGWWWPAILGVLSLGKFPPNLFLAFSLFLSLCPRTPVIMDLELTLIQHDLVLTYLISPQRTYFQRGPILRFVGTAFSLV